MSDHRQLRQAGRLRRFAWLALWAVVGVELLYLAGANGFLASRWGRQTLNRRSEKLAVSWQGAWTWVPGILHVRDLEIRGRARRAEWTTAIDSGRMVVFLPALLRRHFHVLRGRARGAEIALRVAPPAAQTGPSAGRPAWRVSLDGLTIESLRRLRLNEREIRGAGLATGWARFRVRGPVELELTSLVLEDAELLDGGEVAADRLRLDGRLRIDPFVVGEDTVQDLLAGLEGTLELETEASSLGFLAAYLERAPWLRLGGSGHLAADVAVAGGRLVPGSRLTVEGPTIETDLFGLHAVGEGRLAGHVPEGATHTELTVQLPRFAVSRRLDQALLLQGGDLEVVVTNDSTAIDRPAQGLALAVDLPPARVPDLAAYSTYLPQGAGLTLTGGSAELEAELGYAAGTGSGSGWLRLSGRQVEAAYGEIDLRADVRLDGRLSEVRLAEGRIGLAGTRLEIEKVSTRRRGRPHGSGWWGRFRLPTGHLQMALAQPVGAAAVLEAELAGELRDTGPLVALIEQHRPGLSWLRGLLTVHDIAASSRVRIEGPRISFADLEVTGGRKEQLEILGQLDLAPSEPSGVVFARWRRLSAAVALAAGERGWKLRDSRKWYDARAPLHRPPPAAAAKP